MDIKPKKEKKAKKAKKAKNIEKHDNQLETPASTPGTNLQIGKKEKRTRDSSLSSITDDTSVQKKHKKGWSLVSDISFDNALTAPFLLKNEINVTSMKGDTLKIVPILTFKQACFPSQLAKDLSVFPTPTPIQSVAWPSLLEGRDMVGIAKTGSGKTIAFGIPALIHLQNHSFLNAGDSIAVKKPKVLVLSPTRELAMQIQEQFILFGKSSSMSSVCIYGGVPKRPQQDKLRQGADAIIATPGRLIDLFEENSSLCDLSQVSYLVLDEADRMLDAGFEEAIKKIIAKLTSSSRQTVMFSATWPTSIQKMAMTYLKNPVKVTVGSTSLSANTSIEQRVEVLDPVQKESRLLELLKKYHDRKNRVLIFALYKKEAGRLENLLKRNGYNVGAIHGDLTQDQRTRSLEGFRSGAVPLLIATDVAARGIDIPDVEYVINVTFPLTVEDYCHRIGRTGRAGKTGVSHTFFTVVDKALSGALVNVLRGAGQVVPEDLEKFGTHVKKKLGVYGAFAHDIDHTLKAVRTTFADSDSD